MSTDSKSSAQEIIAQVEAVTGYKVEVVADRTLQTQASVNMARGTMTSHILTYNPIILTNPDYFIGFQCGFILRKYSLPPSDRRDFISDGAKVSELVPLLKKNPIGDPKVFGRRLLDGILLQLSSMPLSFRVDGWVRKNYPALRSLQDASIAKQLADNPQVLDAKLKALSPPIIYDSNVAMNAAHALFWSRLEEEPLLYLAFKSTPYAKHGEKLMDIYDSIADEPKTDYELIDAWAKYLGLQDWYSWVPA